MCCWNQWSWSRTLLCESTAQEDQEGRPTHLWCRPHWQCSVLVPCHRHVQSKCHVNLGMILCSSFYIQHINYTCMLVSEWIRFRLCVLIYCCLNGTAPHYFAETIWLVSNIGARQHLQSAETSTLLVPSMRRSTLGHWSFPVSAARAWNTLPQHVRTHLFYCLSSRTEDCSAPVVIPWCNLTMYCALSVCRHSVLICHHVLAYYKLILLTLYDGPAAAVR